MRIFNVVAAGALLLTPVAAAADTPSAAPAAAKASKPKKVCRIQEAAVGRLPAKRVCTEVKPEQAAKAAPAARPVAAPAAKPAAAPAPVLASRDVKPAKEKRVCTVEQAAVGRLPAKRVCRTVKAEQSVDDSLIALDHDATR